jgi:predicted signal transduction protein with EAL and GGDEF domain
VRWGGEEFLVVARFVDRRDAPELAEKIRAAIAGHDFRLPDGTAIQRTGSIGFAAFPFSPAQPRAVAWEEVVDAADHGLYAAKRSGRNRWVGVDAGEAGEPKEALQRFKENPEAALANGAIRVHAPHNASLCWNAI